MRFAGKPRVLVMMAFLGLCAFAGDIVADSIADLRGNHCASESSPSDSQHEKSPCGHCSCAVHNGTVIISNVVVDITAAFGVPVFFLPSVQFTPDGSRLAIDHPPQLA